MSEIDYHAPEYTLEEKEKEILVVIVAPLSKPKEAAFVLEKDVFTFESPPYHLKIKLPHSVCDRFSQKAFDNETKTYKIKLKKSYEFQEDESEVDENDKSLIPVANLKGKKVFNPVQENGEKQFYGFANRYSNMFGKLYSEFSEVINLPDPDFTHFHKRRILRVKEENEKWSDDHYLADTMETDHLKSIFKYKPPWISSPVKSEFKNDENEILLKLINKSKILTLSKKEKALSEFQVVDILFSNAYNVRTTEGDSTVESGWTINKLSSTLSWFEVFENLKDVLVTCYRRSLIFPLYRNWDLAKIIHKDVVNILKAGSKQVTQCLLEVRDVFNESDYRYILNTLYLNDLCNFAYHMTDERCLELSHKVQKIKIKKSEVNQDLPLLEVAAYLTLEEETKRSEKTDSDVKDIVDKIAKINFHQNSNSSSDSSESDGEESNPTDSSDSKESDTKDSSGNEN